MRQLFSGWLSGSSGTGSGVGSGSGSGSGAEVVVVCVVLVVGAVVASVAGGKVVEGEAVVPAGAVVVV